MPHLPMDKRPLSLIRQKSSKKKRPLEDITGSKLIPHDPEELAQNKEYLMLAPRRTPLVQQQMKSGDSSAFPQVYFDTD